MLLFFISCLYLITVNAHQPYGVPPVPLGRSSLPYVPPLAPGVPGAPVGPVPPGVYPRPYQVPGVAPGVIPPALAAVRSPYYDGVVGPAVPIVSYSNEPPVDGTYAFSFTTADGKQAQENGFLKDAFVDNNGEPQGTQVVQGSYSYISPEGTPIQVSYVADENGFRPSGVHIPSDGRAAALPPPLDGFKDPRRLYDPAYNRYNAPYNYRNNYYNQLGPHGPYDHPLRTGAYDHPLRTGAYDHPLRTGAYDHPLRTGTYDRPYNAAYNRYDPYRPYQGYQQPWNNVNHWNAKGNKEDVKKD